MTIFNGLGTHLGNLSRTAAAQTRSISPENFTGAKGQGGRSTDGAARRAARDLGLGWKVSPYILIEPGGTFELADINGQGAIQQIWMTLARGRWRHTILRMYWDDHPQPSVECPIGDFFANGWESYARVDSLAVCVNPGRAFNCYWEMPFYKRARITLENLSDEKIVVYYQINYALAKLPPDTAYFHAQFRRTNPLPYKEVYTIVDNIEGQGQYVGTYMAWGSNNAGWWGEGEIKFYMDEDEKFPTICGTGTEDYFCGAYCFDPGIMEKYAASGYETYNSPYAGLPQVIRADGIYSSQQRFGMYRWHIPDPIRFEQRLNVTMQALGWRTDKDRRYLPLQDDIASVAFWYQAQPANLFPDLPDKDALEVI